MRIRTVAAALALVAITACSSASDPNPTTTAPAAEVGRGTPLEVLDDARDVADQLENRESRLEEMLPEP